MRTIRKLFVSGAGVVTGLVGALVLSQGSPAGKASAATPSTPACTARIDLERSVVIDELQARSNRLAALSGVVSSSTTLTSSDRAALQAILVRDQQGMSSLETQASSASTCAQLSQIAHAMVYDYRVYVLASPQVRMVVAADDLAWAASRLAAIEPQAQAAVNSYPASGGHASALRQLLSDLESRVSSAQQSLGGVPPEVLALQPSGYPGNSSTLRQAASALRAAGADLKQAAHDLSLVIRDLGR
jgi:hypothetical protein